MKINLLNFLSLSKLENKNAFLLNSGKLGYEWWWHSLVAINENTNEIKPFFIEYYVLNPTISKIIQLEPLPSYFMLKAGTWGNDSVEINNFYDLQDVSLNNTIMEIKHKDNLFYANDKYIRGYVNNSYNNLIFQNNKTSTIQWNLTINKKLKYDLGYTTSSFFRNINLAQMYWNIDGMKTEYNGTIIYNNQKYKVISNQSYGYQDKNWGTDLTPKWIWLNCNKFKDINGNSLNSSIAIGGSIPVIFNIKFFETLIIIFYHKNEKYEFNFSKFWKLMKQKINIYRDNNYIYFDITAKNPQIILKINFKCLISNMLFINYQIPNGNIPHKELYNGHHAFGKVLILKRGKDAKVETIYGELGGCEYGNINENIIKN